MPLPLGAIGAGIVLTKMGDAKTMLSKSEDNTIAEWGQKLNCRQRPADWLDLSPLMLPKPELVQTGSAPNSFSSAPVEADAPLAIDLNCATYREKISHPESKFRWNKAKCCGRLQFFPEHHGLFA